MELIWRDGPRGWQRAVLPPTGLGVRRNGGGALELSPEPAAGALARVVPFDEDGVQRAALVAGAAEQVLLDGYATLAISVLDDKSEISAGGERLYLCARAPAQVESFEPGEAAEVRCARCKGVLQAGDAVLRGPCCRAVFHEGSTAVSAQELRCWSLDARCGSCGRPREELAWNLEHDEDDA